MNELKKIDGLPSIIAIETLERTYEAFNRNPWLIVSRFPLAQN